MAHLALPTASPSSRDRALEVLLGASLEPIVDLVAWSPETDTYDVACADGHIRFRRRASTAGDSVQGWVFESELISGRDPTARQDASHFGSLDAERSAVHPSREDNSYPHAFDHVSQLFDHPSAPDLVVLHSASHHWGDRGGHLGEHGSLGIVQARAPFIAAGAGVASVGLVEDSCRLVDVAPTIMGLLGCGHIEGSPTKEPPFRHDGVCLEDLMAHPGRARHVVAMLLDGTNANVLYDLAGRGELPNISLLMDMGSTYRYGAIASLPTVTLSNHTTILTGIHPGHHGILHNAWIDRRTGEQVVTNSPSTWATAMKWLTPGVHTIHHAVHRALPGSTSISINEPCDGGADHSIFEQLRTGEAVARPPRAEELPDATQRFVRPSKDYRWASLVDHTAMEQFCGVWGDCMRGRISAHRGRLGRKSHHKVTGGWFQDDDNSANTSENLVEHRPAGS